MRLPLPSLAITLRKKSSSAGTWLSKQNSSRAVKE